MKRRLPIPVRLLVVVAVLYAAGFAAGPIVKASFTQDQLIQNVLLTAIPFILVFIAIILSFIAVIVVASRLLSGTIAGQLYRTIEMGLIGGIVLGVAGMFQPWVYDLYRAGFLLLLFSTLGFILWSHIKPRGAPPASELGAVSIAEVESPRK